MSEHPHSAPEELIFALDIGTRSVVGLIVEPTGEQFRVIDCTIREHSERSMLDGQIHDVMAVSKVIGKIKEELEEKHGPLTKVAVAAAGRSLRTKRVRMDLPLSRHAAVTRDDVLTLEFSAVQEAQAQLAQELNEQDVTRYYCVGYSVVNYFLDGELIGNLIDQRGEIASVDVIATFLPRMVVDSLLAALHRCGLDMQALTLEPIAAINVLIPVTMRRLNIALVDIGAGTSDVALTEEGAITAYGMVPVAGDEITDALMNAFLLDFPMAEEVKRALTHAEKISFTDILGLEQTLSSEEVVKAILPEITNLAGKIAAKILELNGKPPQAVMLIGGGSLTPKLTERVAEALGLPASRVAVRGADAIRQFVGEHPLLDGPAFVTPVGIAVAARRHPVKYVTVTVNDAAIRIFDLRKMTVGDALIASGLDIRRLHGRPGMAITLTVNGRMRIIPGGHGTPPVIEKNGEACGLDTPISEGDRIVALAGADGEDAQAQVIDLMDKLDTLELTVNDEPVSLGPIALVNGMPHPLDAPLQDRSEVVIRLPRTVEEVLQEAGMLDAGASEGDEEFFRFVVNGRETVLPARMKIIQIGGKDAALSDFIRPGDRLVYREEPYHAPAIRDVIPPEEWVQESISVRFNGQPVTITLSALSITMNGRPADQDEQVENEAVITVKASPPTAPVFSDVFRYVDVSLERPETEGITRLVMLVNGEPASFHTELHAGDKLELYWE
ncbi:cell division protein FtsA [Brevibacillus composti]|uniref:Cell division protein FtsA n=1 Tax=Brevibacillus composti TaxID=2796470 RepID=A0A7T5JPK7_9BACL|nr:cell division protein FtsA [Brevibacillus composti]QQE75553.1 cell division protein FtsA [Brevibacillus composti]QUO42579.1 cell division protein FtsA [Brevibacillus composti]